MKKLIYLFLLFISVADAVAQTDTEFWFAAPQLVTSSVSSRNRDRNLTIVAYSEAVTVKVEMPANSNFQPITVTVPANTTKTIVLCSSTTCFSDIMLTQPANTVVNTGIKITSTGKIGCYYAITQADSEIYTLKGRNALGTEFLVPSQYRRGYSGSAHTIEIVATEDNTTVQITPKHAALGITAGSTVTRTLNKGQAYCVSAASGSAGAQLRNTVITSDKPIAVNTSDDMVEDSQSRDLIGEQLVPTSLCGDKYIAVKNSAGGVEEIYIFPLEDNTTIRVNGTVVTTLNKGGEYYQALTDDATLITSDDGKPFVAFQVTGVKGTNAGYELGGTMLPFVSCTGSAEVTYSPITNSSTQRMVVLAKTRDIEYFKINNMTGWGLTAAEFTALPGDPDWSYAMKLSPAMVDPSTNQKILKIENTQGYFHFGVYDYSGTTMSYGYFSNYNVFPINGKTGKAWYRAGETITLVLDDVTDLTSFSWTGVNGFISSEASPQIVNSTVENAGQYIVSASHKDGCPVDPDTFYVHVFPQTQAAESTICYGENVTLTAPGDAPYLWNTGATTQAITVSPTVSTKYYVDSYRKGSDNLTDFLLTDTFNVAVLDSLKPTISGADICHGSATLSVVGTYGTYLWNTGATTQSITVTQAGDYSVEVTDGACRGSGTFKVYPAPQINVSVTKTPSVCPDETNFEIEYQSIGGQIGSFDIDFKNSGFQNITGEPLTGDKIIVTIPQNTRSDIYNADLTVYEKNCGESQTIPVEIMVKYPSDVIAQRWNDILGVKNADYNGGYNFTAFQWYKNGVAMAGETKSYIYDENEFSAGNTYSVLLTNSVGKQIATCEFTPEYLTTGSVQTLVSPAQSIKLNANGIARFYNMVGTLVSVQNVVDNQATAPNKQGIYYLKFNGKIIKIVVR